jgi:hypothetical protein
MCRDFFNGVIVGVKQNKIPGTLVLENFQQFFIGRCQFLASSSSQLNLLLYFYNFFAIKAFVSRTTRTIVTEPFFIAVSISDFFSLTRFAVFRAFSTKTSKHP